MLEISCYGCKYIQCSMISPLSRSTFFSKEHLQGWNTHVVDIEVVKKLPQYHHMLGEPVRQEA